MGHFFRRCAGRNAQKSGEVASAPGAIQRGAARAPSTAVSKGQSAPAEESLPGGFVALARERGLRASAQPSTRCEDTEHGPHEAAAPAQRPRAPWRWKRTCTRPRVLTEQLDERGWPRGSLASSQYGPAGSAARHGRPAAALNGGGACGCRDVIGPPWLTRPCHRRRLVRRWAARLRRRTALTDEAGGCRSALRGPSCIWSVPRRTVALARLA